MIQEPRRNTDSLELWESSGDKVENGFRVLRDRPVTQNELAWIEMLRAI